MLIAGRLRSLMPKVELRMKTRKRRAQVDRKGMKLELTESMNQFFSENSFTRLVCTMYCSVISENILIVQSLHCGIY